MMLKGKVALVTGGSRGLGRVDALALAEAGADVVVADILMDGAEKTAKEVQAMGRKSFAIKMDVTHMEEVKEGVVRIKNELGSVDILVNSAATLDHLGQLLEQRDKFWERDLRVNLTGTFNCSRAVWPYMQEKKWGRIINMASVAGRVTPRLKQGSSVLLRHWPWKARDMGLPAMSCARELSIQNLFSLSPPK